MKNRLTLPLLLALGLFTSASLHASAVLEAIQADLVTLKGKELTPLTDLPIKDNKYTAFYFSAAWCGPCRGFTPELVKWYKKTKKKNPEFELVFVSSDKSSEQMVEYIKEDDMPWPALNYGKKSEHTKFVRFPGGGIPGLSFVDASGTVLASTFVNDSYVNPREVLRQIDQTLASTATPAAGSEKFDIFKKKN
jgi:nucleoredoxin